MNTCAKGSEIFCKNIIKKVNRIENNLTISDTIRENDMRWGKYRQFLAQRLHIIQEQFYLK
jgi:hypothetical protein